MCLARNASRMLLQGPRLRCFLLLFMTSSAVALDRDMFVQSYCLSCHSASAHLGGLVLEGVPTADPAKQSEVWEKVVRRLTRGEMPPAAAPQPSEADVGAFTSELVAELDTAIEESPYAGRPVIRRLNRTEYSNAIRDLLAIELPLANQLPPDGQAAGFDNIGDALSMSPLLLETYLKVARRVSSLAVGVSDPSPVTETYPATETQAEWQGPGMPFGTRGGVRVRHYFPYDAEYDLRAFLDKQSLTPTEGVRFFRTRVRLTAGAHEIVVTFPDEFAAREGPVSDVSGPGGRALGGPLDLLGTAVRPTLDFRVDGRRVKLFEIWGMTAGESAFDGQPGPPTLGRIEISGPHNITGVTETPSRKRVFTCEPTGTNEERDCASTILTRLTRHAFRRDVDSRDIRPLLDTFAATRRKQAFDASIAAALREILLSPDFLFRLEFDPDDAAPGAAHDVSEFELASRLSFFLWSSIPDERLLDLASEGRLRDELGSEVRRMLADRRSSALVKNFARQWLSLGSLAERKPDAKRYPEFDEALRAAFVRETELFLASVIRENRSVLDFIGADYTYVNERLARNYGIDGVIGPGFRRVSVSQTAERGGLLGQGAILMLTSHAATTSPVLRGKWILENLLNSPPPPPPPGVPALEESAKKGEKLTTRQKVERHRTDPGCASCHASIDPLGFALENFDVLGRWRTEDEGGAINASDSLPNGETFDGPAGLRELLLRHPERFAGATVERLLTYALGRQLVARDQPTVRGILREAKAGGYRLEDLIIGIVRSTPFQMRQSPWN